MRKWPPRLSVRSAAAAVSAVATWCTFVVSHSAACGCATTSLASCASVRTAARRVAAAASPSPSRRTPGPADAIDWMRERAAAATSADGPGRSTGSPTSSSPEATRSVICRAARWAKTKPSSSEFDARRFAPCTPVHATSPIA